jgi:predicted GNAT family N-acyltransferase
MNQCKATSLTCEKNLLDFYSRYGFEQVAEQADGRIRMMKIAKRAQ